MNLLMISGDRELLSGKKGPFYYSLQEFSKHWDRIDVITGGRKRLPAPQQYFENVYIHDCHKTTWAIAAKAREIYHRSRYGVITVHDYPPFRNTKAVRRLAKKLRIPYMIEIHHVVGHPKAANLKEKLLKVYFELFFPRLARSAAAIRVVNQFQVPEFLVRLGIEREKIVHLPSFYLDSKIFHQQNIEKKYDLLFAGRLVSNKGLDLLVKIIALEKKVNPKIKVGIVGSGPEEMKFKKEIRQLGLHENVVYLGWLKNNQELASVYNQAKVLLVTSYNEGGPRVGLEAMACGTPVISTKVGIMLDIIKNGENGFLVDNAPEKFMEKINYLLNNDQDYWRISRQAAEIIKQFDYRALIKNYADKLKALV